MKKQWILALVLALALALTGCSCKHETWEPATCEKAKTCTECGETEGAPLGHSWLVATCENAKTCEVCGKTQGEALDHQWTEATCEIPETCQVCGKTRGEAFGHQWQDATTEMPRTCVACSKTEGEKLPKPEPVVPTGLYYVKISDPSCPIYYGPGYEYGINTYIGEAGIYTVMEQEYDDDGNLWGRMKSGLGWVVVNDLPKEYLSSVQVTLEFADRSLLQSGDYQIVLRSDSAYANPVSIQAQQQLGLCSLWEIVDGNDRLGRQLATWSGLRKGKRVMAWLDFPGDMSAYGLCVTDANGVEHWYCVYISGRNGMLEMYAITPKW